MGGLPSPAPGKRAAGTGLVEVRETEKVSSFPFVVPGLSACLPGSRRPPPDGGLTTAALHPPSGVEDAVTTGSRGAEMCADISLVQADKPSVTAPWHHCFAASGGPRAAGVA